MDRIRMVTHSHRIRFPCQIDRHRMGVEHLVGKELMAQRIEGVAVEEVVGLAVAIGVREQPGNVKFQNVAFEPDGLDFESDGEQDADVLGERALQCIAAADRQ